jgi:hypothetical protein
MNNKKLLYTLLLGATLTSCAEVDICEREHPHTGDVNFTYKWKKPADKPKYMAVLCCRVVGHWKELAEVDTDDLTLRLLGKTSIAQEGRLGGNPDGDNPNGENTGSDDNVEGTGQTGDASLEHLALLAYADEPATPENPDETTPPGDTGEGTTLEGPSTAFKSEIKVPRGYYKFVTFPLDNHSIDYSEVEKFMLTDADKYPLQNVGLSYRVYGINDPKLKKPLAWHDFNPYVNYIQPDVYPFYYDSTQVKRVKSDNLMTFEFKPRLLSQNIDINFNIVKNTDDIQFYVTEVWAEISGVPTYMKMGTGYLDITKTSKMLFKTDIKPSNPDDEGNDTFGNKRIYCSVES